MSTSQCCQQQVQLFKVLSAPLGGRHGQTVVTCGGWSGLGPGSPAPSVWVLNGLPGLAVGDLPVEAGRDGSGPPLLLLELSRTCPPGVFSLPGASWPLLLQKCLWPPLSAWQVLLVPIPDPRVAKHCGHLARRSSPPSHLLPLTPVLSSNQQLLGSP